ncbi:MAG: hypothetical protein B7Z26_05255, partial [Asticcacaulis sp. 32-58-5]
MTPDPLADSIATGDWLRVEALAQVRLSLKPDDTQTRRYLALALERQNRLPEAFDAYQDLLAHLPSPPPSDVVHDLARLAFRLDQMDMAEKLYGFVVQSEPDNVTAIAGLA